jgi:hypothetical protein
MEKVNKKATNKTSNLILMLYKIELNNAANIPFRDKKTDADIK